MNLHKFSFTADVQPIGVEQDNFYRSVNPIEQSAIHEMQEMISWLVEIAR